MASAVPSVDSERSLIALCSDGTRSNAKEFRGEKIGYARESVGIPLERADATEPMDSDRKGAPNRRDGMPEPMEATEPMEAKESDRMGAARRKFGKVMTEIPPLVDSESPRLGLLFSESFTMCPHETLLLY